MVRSGVWIDGKSLSMSEIQRQSENYFIENLLLEIVFAQVEY